MKVALGFSASVLSSIALALPNAPERPPLDHPLIGKWQWTREVNNCTEIYDYRPDGTAPVVSGTEKTENTYNVAESPDINGFYRSTMRVVKDYGGKDCADDESASTGESVSYIIFDPTKSIHVSCAEPKLDKCFGPLHRVKE